MTDYKTWLTDNGIVEVQCLLPDVNGVLRGKILPTDKFMEGLASGSLRIASSLFSVAITGAYAGIGDVSIQDPDRVLRPDVCTLRRVPEASIPTAAVFCDVEETDGTLWAGAPRAILRRCLELYGSRGWTPIVAPELEFYLIAASADFEQPLVAPVISMGRAETVADPYGLDALDTYRPVTEVIYARSKIAGLPLDTIIHESGTAQLEINFKHGEALPAADQVLQFKRIVKKAAAEQGYAATFMAKPMAEQPGSAMHVHISLCDATGVNVFAMPDGTDSTIFLSFIGGLQTYLPEVAPLFAPHANSFRRMRPCHSAPVNVEWSRDNRSCGLRVPIDSAHNRRIEYRLPGADANPYLAIAAALAAGWLGIEKGLKPREPENGNAYRQPRSLPATLEEALARMGRCEPMAALLGESFFDAFRSIKQSELDHFQGVVTPWEREYLALKV